MINRTDKELIYFVKNKNNEALHELLRRYQPIINNVRGKYYIRHFDVDDWNQEAMIVCYETCCMFDLDRRREFGAFFKANFTNHAKNLLRYELAKRRAPYAKAVSYEVVKETGAVNEQGFSLTEEPLNEIYRQFILGLSKIELLAMLTYLGRITCEEAARRGSCSIEQITRAKGRLKKKLSSILGS